VPVTIGKNGFEEVVKLDINKNEIEMFEKSVKAVKQTNQALDGLI
jgi:malate/lactate dehydrogenase